MSKKLRKLKICGVCEGPLGLLGILGNKYHYECRHCGMKFSSNVYRRLRVGDKVR